MTSGGVGYSIWPKQRNMTSSEIGYSRVYENKKMTSVGLWN